MDESVQQQLQPQRAPANKRPSALRKINMNKRPFVASILFTGLSCAGILTMFAQSQPIDEFGAPIHAE